MRKHIFIIALGILLFAGTPTFASALSTGQTITRINELLAIVAGLQKQLADLLQSAQAEAATQPTAAPVTILSPDNGGALGNGYPLDIAWKGGHKKVQVGIVDEDYELADKVLGWIGLSEKPDSSLSWDGETLSDITGTVRSKLSTLSPGPYKVLVVSANAKGQYCVSGLDGCNVAVSRSYFSIVPRAAPPAGALSASCMPSVEEVYTNAEMLWRADAANGVSPYRFAWSGTDDISQLPSSSSNSSFLSVVYYRPGTKSAVVTVMDADGRSHTAMCSPFLKVLPAPPPLMVLSPSGGKSFNLAKSVDPSYFMRVSWSIAELPTIGERKTTVGLVDGAGRFCPLAEVPVMAREAAVPLLDGYLCPGSGVKLAPGSYYVRVAVNGYEPSLSDISDAAISLVAPLSDAQSIAPSASTVKSGESVTFRFTAPPNTVRASLNVFCPTGLTSTTANVCNRYTNVLSYVASSTSYSATFVNTSGREQTVSANFYVYLPNNPAYARGVKTEVKVLPAPAAGSQALKVVAPNGGETVFTGSSYTYRFTPTSSGVVDLSLIPDPPVDSSRVCTLATGISPVGGQIIYTIPAVGTCVKGPAKTVSGAYKLFLTYRNGDSTASTDSSDSSFTISASSTPSQ